MKKRIALIGLLAMTIVLAACSAEEAQELEEVFSKATEASENLDNFAMEVVSEQTFETDAEEGSSPLPTGVPITTTLDSEIQMDPMAFHQTIEMDMMGNTEMEQYYTEEGLFIKPSEQEGWLKAPEEMMEQLNALSSKQQTPVEQLKQVEDYIDEFTMEMEDSNYVLTFSSSGEDVQKMLEDTMSDMLPEGTFPEDMMESVTINSINYEYTIDKESYYPKHMVVDMNMTIEQDGEKVTIDQSMEGSYSKFNEVGEITVPEEVIQNAQEMPDLGQTP
ncbi:DUF6612 family protein [Halobacillus salinus]|uniref:LppX_LprAFG lipoprotein n=1 Tax=Halobacillus salinus TaxID=192814 RepID=A0A4Z0GXI1_9BACI|nr:DUF6612 family protein [Halobacillus salinus]TGB02157.1 hypothetical protein E4663_12465 [Halobacillus salinus]